jgi:hypothetical protein
MEPGALEPMLEVLVGKGQVRCDEAGCSERCSGCTRADREDLLVYELSGWSPGAPSPSRRRPPRQTVRRLASVVTALRTQNPLTSAVRRSIFGGPN